MKPCTTWTEAAADCRSGVSLHSHTSHSRETLECLPRLAEGSPLLRGMLRLAADCYRRQRNRELDYRAEWWRPPLGPREALALERGQIEQLGLRPLVSITDHDNIEAPQLLRLLSESRDMPVSVEWTVPWRGTEFHVGVHQMAPRRASEKMAALRAFTADPGEQELGGLLEWLAEEPETLIVLNHPLWDEKGVGRDRHAGLAIAFVREYRRWVHALELNGLRAKAENHLVLEMAAQLGMAAVAGGDRHGMEPNALINVTRARTFAEFVEEIREDRISSVVSMPQYGVPRYMRIASLVLEVLRARWDGWHPEEKSASTIRGSCVRDSSY